MTVLLLHEYYPLKLFYYFVIRNPKSWSGTLISVTKRKRLSKKVLLEQVKIINREYESFYIGDGRIRLVSGGLQFIYDIEKTWTYK